MNRYQIILLVCFVGSVVCHATNESTVAEWAIMGEILFGLTYTLYLIRLKFSPRDSLGVIADFFKAILFGSLVITFVSYITKHLGETAREVPPKQMLENVVSVVRSLGDGFMDFIRATYNLIQSGFSDWSEYDGSSRSLSWIVAGVGGCMIFFFVVSKYSQGGTRRYE